MDADRYQRLKRILFEAQRVPGPQRDTFLADACGTDHDLRREVEELLRGAQVDTMALQEPVGNAAVGASDFPPPPWHCGRYRIEREVGRGGMGVVFEATDLAGEGRVAVKLVPPVFASTPALLDRFAREAELGRQIDHPHVVRTLDFGSVSMHGRDVPFLVMEFVEGRHLRDLLEELGTVPESLIRAIAEQVGAGLAAIHAHGIVHRDLKPENVLITHDQTIRIMDLGIAKLHDATMELTREGQFIGSLHYASPEQCLGGAVQAPADLYSLGVVLHELATGANPFRRDNPAAAIHAHAEVDPPRVHEQDRRLSPFLGELIHTLLRKEPEARFATTEAFVATVRAGEQSTWWARHGGESGAVTHVHVDVGRRTPMIGRADQLARLRDAQGKDGGVFLVSGEAGIGKSRLVDEFLSGLPSTGTHLLYGSFQEGGGLQGFLESVLRLFPAARLDDALAPYFENTPGLLRTFVAFLRGDPLPAGGGSAIEAAASRLFAGLAAERPTVWVLEDLQDAPAAAWRVVQAMARAASREGALLVLTARPTLDEDRLVSLGITERIELARLRDRALSALVEFAAGGLSDRTGLLDAVASKSDGNPFFALAIVSSWRPGTGAEAGVPSEVRDLIGARLAGLDRRLREMLDVAAVQGFEFDAELVAGVLDQPLVGVLQDLADIERRTGLVRALGRRYRFDHGLLQEILSSELPERLRAEYHLRLADSYAEQVEGEPWGRQAAFLARHYLAGADPSRAVPFLAAALEHLEHRHLHEAMIELIDQARTIESLDARERMMLLERKARRQNVLGRRDEERETVTELVQLAEKHGDAAFRARGWVALGSWHQRGGREPEGLEAYERAIELARRSGDRALACKTIYSAGNALARLRRGDEALERHEEALRIAVELDRADLEATARAQTGQALRHRGRFEEARAMYEAGLACAARIEDEELQAHLRGSLGMVHTELGNWTDAERYLRAQLEFGRSMGFRPYESQATGNLGIVLLYEGRIGEAREFSRRHRTLTAEISSRRSEAVAIGALGAVEVVLGNTERARALLVEARKRALATHAPQLMAAYELWLGRLALAHNETRKAQDHLRQAEQSFRRITSPDGLARCLIDHAAAALADGRRGDAQARLDEVKQLAEERPLPALQLGAAALLDADEARSLDAAIGDRVPAYERLLARARMGWTPGARELLER
ncbi:MAG: protein kinase, partial [Planctomycetota bacterium]